jgi:hypothetical protein
MPDDLERGVSSEEYTSRNVLLPIYGIEHDETGPTQDGQTQGASLLWHER